MCQAITLVSNPREQKFLYSFPDICPADECFATAPVEIISPGYPQKYPNNVDKTWYIKLPVGNKVSLSFIDFDVENENTCR